VFVTVIHFHLGLHSYRGGYAAWLHGCIPQEGGWDTGVGRSSSIGQTVESSLRPPRLAIWKEVSSLNSLQCKNTPIYFSSNAFGKVKNLKHLPTTITAWILVTAELLVPF